MDKTVKLWDMMQAGNGQNIQTNILNPQGSFLHEHTAYQAVWHPTHESIFGSCAGD